MSVDDLRQLSLFDGTGDEQLAEFLAAGTAVPFVPGDVLFVENQHADFWWVLVAGSIELVRNVRGEETRLGVMGEPGQWSGGFRAWDEHGVYLATGRASTSGRILQVPSQDLRRIWAGRFPLGLYLTEGVSRSARNFENLARQKEALVALGTLAAGLAHELNNPAAAATRAVDALGQACDEMLSALRRLAAASIGADQFTVLDELRREVGPKATGADALATADREAALSTWLSRHGVAREWEIAAALAAAQVDVAWCERTNEALGDTALEPGLEWVASTLSVAGLLGEVKESTRRISELVGAVKSYSQLDRASMQQTDVTEGLDSTLAMLAHRIPPAVTVVREYDSDVPRIEALAAELNQVWTNLVSNALDAMVDQGTLRVSTRMDKDAVVVEVGDTGPGMSAETRDHAFDPFFTTKGVGEGTGLGLDISRRIVDRHNGGIAIETRPGETVLRVSLPPYRSATR
ncbi:MAG: cyclic nucleotide-binding domain-containing protein [Streptosporangiales bacterium]|nr:cyclic nucleotide-binding domain-containing protein [Streptosporangiales bacterium]